eukprot:124623-Prorocentrum_minimum.AAC.1
MMVRDEWAVYCWTHCDKQETPATTTPTRKRAWALLLVTSLINVSQNDVGGCTVHLGTVGAIAMHPIVTSRPDGGTSTLGRGRGVCGCMVWTASVTGFE